MAEVAAHRGEGELKRMMEHMKQDLLRDQLQTAAAVNPCGAPAYRLVVQADRADICGHVSDQIHVGRAAGRQRSANGCVEWFG
jgi:hypothetical protein